MQKLIKYLSSMKMAAVLIISMVIVLLIGGFLTEFDSIHEAFKEMNHYIVLDWILNVTKHNAALLIWFVILCILAVLLGINLILCSWENLLKGYLRKKGLKPLLLLSIHVVFVIIMLLHAISLLVGFKYGNVILKEGDEFAFENNYKVELKEIDFVDDPNILIKEKNSSRLAMTSDKFHYKQNNATIIVYEDNLIMAESEVKIFEPLFYNGIQITLEKFVMDRKSDEIAVKIAITKNPFVLYFFIFYGLVILLMLIYAIVRWRR